jgi:hypothetical protein
MPENPPIHEAHAVIVVTSKPRPQTKARFRAALHEGAHVLVGYRLGFEVQGVHIYYRNGAWRGFAEIDLTQGSEAQFLPTLMAGYAGETLSESPDFGLMAGDYRILAAYVQTGERHGWSHDGSVSEAIEKAIGMHHPDFYRIRDAGVKTAREILWSNYSRWRRLGKVLSVKGSLDGPAILKYLEWEAD